MLVVQVFVSISVFSQGEEFNCISGDCENGIGKAEYVQESQKYVYEGNFVNGFWEGNGTLKAEGIYIYRGVFVQSVFQGKGELEYPNGDKYIGEFSEMNFNGKGIFYYKSGEKLEGEFRKGKIWNGNGFLPHSDKTYYKGAFLNGRLHGFGIFIFEDGSSFEGNFENDQPNGYGTIKYTDGSKYVGYVLNSKPNGEGKYYDSKGVLIYSGQWKNGERFVDQSGIYKKALSRCFKGYQTLSVNGQSGSAKIGLCLSTFSDLTVDGSYTFEVTIDGISYEATCFVYGKINSSNNTVKLSIGGIKSQDDLPYGMNWDFNVTLNLTILEDSNHKGYYILEGYNSKGEKMQLSDY